MVRPWSESGNAGAPRRWLEADLRMVAWVSRPGQLMSAGSGSGLPPFSWTPFQRRMRPGVHDGSVIPGVSGRCAPLRLHGRWCPNVVFTDHHEGGRNQGPSRDPAVYCRDTRPEDVGRVPRAAEMLRIEDGLSPAADIGARPGCWVLHLLPDSHASGQASGLGSARRCSHTWRIRSLTRRM